MKQPTHPRRSSSSKLGQRSDTDACLSFPFLKLTLLLEEPVNCVVGHCKDFITGTAQQSAREIVGQNCNQLLPYRQLDRLTEHLLCRTHSTDGWRRACQLKWSRYFSQNDSAPSTPSRSKTRSRDKLESTPLSVRSAGKRCQSTSEIIDLVTDDESCSAGLATPTPMARRTPALGSDRVRSVSDSNITSGKQAAKTSSSAHRASRMASSKASRITSATLEQAKGTATESSDTPAKSSGLNLNREATFSPFSSTDSWHDLQPGSVELLTDLQRISDAEAIIPREVMELAVMELSVGLLHLRNFENEEATHNANTRKNEGTDGEGAFWEEVRGILKEAWTAYDRCKDEPSWNSEVHSKILRMALQGSQKTSTRLHKKTKDVWYEDVSKARISSSCRPSSRPKEPSPMTSPRSSARTNTTSSKMVDYAIHIEPDDSLLDDISAKLLIEDKSRSINHTDKICLYASPIAISIETKRAGGDEFEGTRQLVSWVSAHYTRLHQLVTSETSCNGEQHNHGPHHFPDLPLILVIGHDWKFMIAHPCANEERLRIMRGMKIGSTESVLGIYQLISSIRRLCRWINEVYRPWFEQTVLGNRVQ